MKKALLLLAVVLLVGCAGSQFEQKQYYKDGNSNRIYCVYTQESDSAKLFDYAKKEMFTAGQQTRVYFFNKAEDVPQIEIRGGLNHVFQILYSNKKAFAMYEKYDNFEELMYHPFSEEME